MLKWCQNKKSENLLLDDTFLDLMGPARASSVEPSQVARLDSYSFSMHNLQESQDNELDAILGELCALGSQFERELHGLRAATEDCQAPISVTGWGMIAAEKGGGHVGAATPVPMGHPTCVGSNKEATRTIVPATPITASQNVRSAPESVNTIAGARGDGRTDSPDNDSAFSDSISMLSGESSASSGARTSSSQESAKRMGGQPIGTLTVNDDLATAACLHDVQRSQAEQAAQLKAEKIKMALQKLKEASIRKLFIKVFCSDGSAKSLLVDETMSVAYLTKLLAEKSHVSMDPKWALVETIPELYMERIYEEHENLVENLLLWTRDSSNRILFEERPLKYDMFAQPEKYLADSGTQTQLDIDEDQRTGLIEEFFLSPGTSGVSVPEVEGQLYLKAEGKKHWKKHFFVLRASGLYYCPKGKSKLPKDLVCLTTFEMNCVYYGVGWKKKYKAPSEFCFAMKHPQIQSKSCKNIKYLCADDLPTLNKWVTGIRIAKYGRQIKDNYDAIQRDIVEADLEKLAYHRSFSVSSMAKQLAVSPDSSNSSEGSPIDQNGQVQHHPANHRLRHSTSTGSDSTLLAEAVSETTPAVHQTGNGRPNSEVVAQLPANTTPQASSNGATTLRRRDSIASSSGGSSSIGSMSSDRSSVASDPAVAFDLDFPGGTIKRKPNLTQPRLPLTNTTRSLVKDTSSASGVSGVGSSLDDSASIVSGSSFGSGGSLGRTAGLRFSLRRSHTDEQMTATLARLKQRQQLSVSSPTAPVPPAGCTIAVVKGGPLTPTKAVQLLPMPPVDASSLEDISEASQATPKASPQHAPVAPLTAKNLEKLAQDLAAQCRTDFKVVSIPEKPPSVIYAESTSLKEQSTSAANVQSLGSDTASSHYQASSNLSSVSSQLGMSSTSIDSLPPPPPIPLAEQGSWPSVSSLSSLPPPPSNLTTPTNSPPLSNQATPTAGSPMYNSGSNQATPTNERAPLWLTRSPPATQNGSPSGSPCRSKPTPPRRSETTRLSSPSSKPPIQIHLGQKEELHPSPMTSPPDAFLRDLHRVMDKKWKVAQTLNTMQDHTPHQILGFRDPRLLSEDERKAPLRGILLQESTSSSPSGPRVPKQVRLDLPGLVCSSPKAKPAPPKRSDSTQLSCTLQSPASPMGQQRLGIY
ncbi:ras-associated and pleckstrin homology domains-containing protein 1-like isoform X2 [Varroa destructor]|uniref:Uncharacterized protein n=1 Tax=Varroa destructor TaxID=109461 RepID=A0A7M7KTA7_VARDE|nr:ras-associated and pleckstrin homology domains-containing protein 1-like isoform X2 [Varroa destructor]